MTDLPSLMVAISRVASEAQATLQTLAAALRDEDLDRARTVLEQYVTDAGEILAGIAPAPTPAPPPEPVTNSGGGGDPEHDVRRWLRNLAKLLTAWRLEDAERTAALHPPAVPPRLARAPALALSGIRAVRAGRHADAREMVDLLLRARDASERPRHVVGSAKRALLLVYLGRVALFAEHDLERAAECFDAAARLDPDSGVVLAAHGNLQQARGATGQALASYQHAITAEPLLPDGYVGMGRLATAEGRFDEAAAWYERALDGLDGATWESAGRLLSPVPAGLMYECGLRRVEADPAAAERDFGAALQAPEPPEPALRARIQAARSTVLAHADPVWAAEAAVQAASPDVLPDDERLDLLEHAIELDPQHPTARWLLAERQRMLSLGPGDLDEMRTWTRRAADTWARAHEDGDPPPELAWMYTTRALIAERMVELGAQDGLAETWSAVAWIERGLLEQSDAYPWLHLSRLFRALEMDANAREASSRAVELAPDDEYAITERVWALLVAGDPQEAVELIEPRLDDDPTIWMQLAAGYALAEAGRHEDALSLAREVLARTDREPETETLETQLLALCAYCLRGLGRRDEELEVLERVVAVSEGDPDPTERGAALYVVGLRRGDRGLLAQAAETFEAALHDSAAENRWSLLHGGLARLAVGDPGGAEWIRRSIERFHIPADLEVMADWIAELEPRAPHAVQPAVKELRTAALAARAEARLEAPLEELSAHHEDERARTAVGMSVARARREAGDWVGALREEEAMRGVLDESARRALARATVGAWLADVSAQLNTRDPDDACDLLALAAEHAAAAADPALEAEVLGALVVSRLRLGDPAAASVALARALERFAQAGTENPVAAVWARCGPLAWDAEELWGLDDLPWPVDDGHAAEPRPLYVAPYLAGLAEQGTAKEPAHDPRPVVKLGEALIPFDPGPTWSLFATHMPAMRRRVEADTGFSVPGARFRGGDDVTPSEYSVIIGGLQADRAIVRGTSDAEPIELVVQGLEQVVRRNLDQFVAVDDARRLVEQADGTLPVDRPAILRVVAVARALARDRVPLTAVDVMVKHALTSRDAIAAIEQVRLALWDRLPGNGADHRRVPLPDSLQREIDATFDLSRGTIALARSPREVDRLERMLAEWVAGNTPSSLAIVVETEAERRVTQRLARRHHPDVPVLVHAGTREAMDRAAETEELRA